MNDNSAVPDLPRFPGVDKNFHFLAYPEHLLVWVSDTDGLCSFVSPSWTIFTGRERLKELGNGWVDGVHADDREALAHGINEASRSKQSFRLMHRYLREDGVYRWFVNQGMPQTTPAGEFTGHLGLCFDVTPYQEGEAEMECSIQNIFPLLRQTRLMAVILDIHGHVQFSNGGLCRQLKCVGTQLMDCNLFERHLATNDRGLLQTLYPDGTQSTHFPAEFHSELLTGDNQSRFISWHSVVWREYSGSIKGVVLIGDDVTALRREEEQTSLYTKAFEATDHAIVVTDAAGNIISVNQAFTVLTGYSRDEALGNNPRILQSGRHDKDFYDQLWATLLATGHWHGDVWDRRKDGGIYPKYLSISAVKNSGGKLTNYVGIFYDNSERKTVEERLDHLAHYDTLTGAPNRCLLLDRLDQAIERAIRLGSRVALLYIDLDHFKLINDTHGHSVGDELLKAATQRMTTCVRAVDTIARLGGDEFVVLIPDTSESEDINIVAKKLLEALSPPYEIEGRLLVSTPSIGISIYPDDGSSWKELMKHADAAMYQVKQGGRANFKFFDNMAPAEKEGD
jgi:diguanylate cyclase (GGDEF)-like protein/PAS domain S-box-containing protein